MSVIHAPKKPELDARHLLFPIVLAVCFLLLLLRLWYVQVVMGPELSERARTLQVTSVPKLAPRGLIYDRNGKLLAGVHSSLVVTAVPAIVDKNPWVLDRLASMLDAPVEKLRKAVADARWRRHFPAPIYVGMPMDVAAKIAEEGEDLPGIGVETQPMRYYPDTYSFAHVLGYVWTPNERDEERLQKLGIRPATYVGKMGIEAFYEGFLVGLPGAEKYELDAKRRPVRVAGVEPAVPGAQLQLTLDADLQKVAMEQLRGRRGAVVAIEPSTGEVLCFYSSPSFNTEPFGRGIREGEYRELVENPEHPLINRAFDVNSSFSPGSTFKPVTTMAAIRAGVFDPNRTVHCPGYYEIGNRRVKCLGQHGTVSYRYALAHSCNTYFCDLAILAGPEALRAAALEAGMGERTGIDLRGEGTGIIPTDAWIKKWRDDGKWYPGDTVNMGIGQGETAATPLQMANLAALIANRGVSYKPHLLRERVNPGREATYTDKTELSHVSLSADEWQIMQDAMVAVVEEGSARVARIPGIVWAGKTGSAEKRGQNLTNSWFIGYAPANSPRIAICVLGESVGHGADFAAPVARAVVEQYLQPTR